MDHQAAELEPCTHELLAVNVFHVSQHVSETLEDLSFFLKPQKKIHLVQPITSFLIYFLFPTELAPPTGLTTDIESVNTDMFWPVFPLLILCERSPVFLLPVRVPQNQS